METHCLLTESAELRVALLSGSEVSGGSSFLRKHHCRGDVLLFSHVDARACLYVMMYEYEELFDGL